MRARLWSIPIRVIAGCLVFTGLLSASGADLPSPTNLLQRVLERAEWVARTGATNQYLYDKKSIVDELDEREQVIKSTEKLYEVTLIGGIPFPKLIKIHGRDLSPKELEKENEREAKFRQRVSKVDVNKKARRKEGMVTKDLIERFEFKVIGRETVAGRATLLMTFKARDGADEKSMEDKVFKRVSGTVWVDEEEAEVAKLDAGLSGNIPLGWFGAIGALNKFQATLVRVRLPDGVWVNQRSSFWIVARKLFTHIRTRTVEESSRFRRD